jgi:L-alanine-DL-glutamate epimerase-like enolase superfamily enzyme
MALSSEPLDLKLHVPFTIARGTRLFATNVRVQLADGGHTGIGEAAPNPHYGELQGTALAFLQQAASALGDQNFPITTLHATLDGVARLNPAAKAAIDMAAYDLLGKRLGVPLYELLGLDPALTPRTSYTIGIDTPAIMAQKAAEASDYPILKVKVGTQHDDANLEAIRSVRPDAVIRVDANAAWSPKEAVERLEELSIYDLEFAEQPVPGHDLEGLGYVRNSISLPIIADESCVVPADVPRVAPYVDGINIKLMKCGGIYPALQMIHLARAHDLKVMMGCMIESSLAVTAAAQLSPLLDWADLDGNLLIDDDPYQGVTVLDGKLVLPAGPGLGVQAR